MGTGTMTSRQVDVLNKYCLADKVRLLSRVITSTYDEVLRPLSITTSQMNVLAVTAKYEPASPSQVGQWLHMEKSTLSRNVELLRKHGWIEITPGRGRSHQLRLTARGKRVMEQGMPLWEKAQRSRDLDSQLTAA